MDRIKIKMLKDALEFVKSLPLDASTKCCLKEIDKAESLRKEYFNQKKDK